MGAAPIAIADRIQEYLRQIDRTPGWLADKAGLERSTVTRILAGHRAPKADTLDHIAGVFGKSLSEFVADTDVEDRVADDEKMVSRRDFDGVMRQMISFERRNNELDARLRDSAETVRGLEFQVRELKSDNSSLRREKAFIERERDQARSEATRVEVEARRYRDGLQRAVQDVALLKGQLAEMSKKVDDSRLAGRAAAALAGIAAVVTVASYVGSETHEPRRSRKERPR